MSAEIKKVKDVLSLNLSIPDYQRPYCWTIKNTLQLLEDVYSSWKQVKSAYLIGSVILYKKEETNLLEIVDGQQRITTLTLIFINLSSNYSGLANNLKFQHIDSQNAIIKNNQFIKEWLNDVIIDHEKQEFLKYIEEFCSFVQVIVSKQSEAFQMFDSQNSKGKSLEAYNLLKAYHIRAMETDTEPIKIACDRQWENSTRYSVEKDKTKDILKQLFNEQLYRTRIWSRKEYAYSFSKKDIEEFKGQTINFHKNLDFPYQNQDLLQYFALNHLESLNVQIRGIKSRFLAKNLNNVNPFTSINQNIINGKPFFDYIETYTEIYKQLFILDDGNTLKDFKIFYKKYCEYEKSYRSGDTYIKELYKSLIMLVFDKYGEEGVNKYYEIIYCSVYRLRLERYQVKYEMVLKYATDNNLFGIIENSQNYQNLRVFSEIMMKDIECRRVSEVDIVHLMKDKKVTLSSKDNNITIALNKLEKND